MSDPNYDYWEISLSEVFEEVGIPLPDDDKFQTLVEAIKGCAEVQGEYQGRYAISDPRDTELAELKRLLKQEREVAERRERIYADEIASRYGYPTDFFVSIEGSRVLVEEKLR